MSTDVAPEFKDTQNRYRTQSLFAEYEIPNYPAYFTLSREGKPGYISLYQKYMEIADPTEWEFSQKMFGSWEHWELLTTKLWFKNHVKRWRDELRVRLFSEQRRKMEEISISGKTATERMQALRWLAAQDKAPVKSTRGRPSRDEIDSQIKRELEALEEISNDANRLGIN